LEERAQSLMYACRNWDTEKCHREVSKWKSMEGLRDNEGIILSARKEEVDEICRNCPSLKLR